jgi:hypothetical protein
VSSPRISERISGPAFPGWHFRQTGIRKIEPPPLYFFYGTLIDPAVRSAVLGAYVNDESVSPARLAGWRIVGVRGQTYPVIVPAAAAAVDGVAVSFGGYPVGERLLAFEGPEYLSRSVILDSGDEASVFVASKICRPTGLPWDFDNWRRRHKRACLAGLPQGRLL